MKQYKKTLLRRLINVLISNVW